MPRPSADWCWVLTPSNKCPVLLEGLVSNIGKALWTELRRDLLVSGSLTNRPEGRGLQPDYAPGTVKPRYIQQTRTQHMTMTQLQVKPQPN